MAANLNANTFASSNNFGGKEKASAFLNLSLPSAKGTTKAVGGIPLRMSVPSERQLIEFLRIEGNLAKIKDALTLGFHEVDENAAGGFKLD